VGQLSLIDIVTTLPAGQQMSRGSFSGTGNRFVSSPLIPALGPTQRPNAVGTGGYALPVKRQRREADH
jgi:hypothetical protein